jgi:predicted O-methyltransferase YrrM
MAALPRGSKPKAKKKKPMAGEILNPMVETYLYSMLPQRDPVVREMERYAKDHNVPIIGPAVARLLYLLAQLTGARRIFEMGSAIGYSTVWLARAAGPGGRVFYTDSSEENMRRARGYLQRAGVATRVRFLQGDALESIKTVSGKFDLIFLDVDKPQYPDALHVALPRLRRGGLFITDNTLWSGKVAGTATDEATKAIRRFNKEVYSSSKLFPVIVPLRDGVAVCRKL